MWHLYRISSTAGWWWVSIAGAAIHHTTSPFHIVGASNKWEVPNACHVATTAILTVLPPVATSLVVCVYVLGLSVGYDHKIKPSITTLQLLGNLGRIAAGRAAGVNLLEATKEHWHLPSINEFIRFKQLLNSFQSSEDTPIHEDVGAVHNLQAVVSICNLFYWRVMLV